MAYQRLYPDGREGAEPAEYRRRCHSCYLVAAIVWIVGAVGECGDTMIDHRIDALRYHMEMHLNQHTTNAKEWAERQLGLMNVWGASFPISSLLVPTTPEERRKAIRRVK